METPEKMSDEEFQTHCNSLRAKFNLAVKEEFAYSTDEAFMSRDQLDVIFNVSKSLMQTSLEFLLGIVPPEERQLH